MRHLPPAGIAGRRLLVHGCGNVGATVAAECVARGAAEVLTIDALPARADIPGCVNVTERDGRDFAWWAEELDALVPCSASGLLTPERAAELRCEFFVGATNLPFQSEAAREVAERERGVKFVPEGISSAGAVIVDSIEHYARADFVAAPPQQVRSGLRVPGRSRRLAVSRTTDSVKSRAFVVASRRPPDEVVGRRTVRVSIGVSQKNNNICAVVRRGGQLYDVMSRHDVSHKDWMASHNDE